MSITTTTARRTTKPADDVGKARLGAVAVAVLAPLAIWGIVEGAFGTDLRAPATASGEPSDIGALAVLTASALASLVGWGLLALLERFSGRAHSVWAVVAALVLVLSLGGPLGGTGITAASRIPLVLMHVAVAAVLIPLLYRTASPRVGEPAG